jgi:predicted DNA-binding transcriptional regulator AlpA
MTSKFTVQSGTPSDKSASAIPVVLTPKEAADRLKLSASWLAKARMRGDGPPYIQVGRAIRYTEGALLQWMKSHTRTSTSQS